MDNIRLEATDLTIAACLVFALAGMTWRMSQGLGRSIVIGAIRTTVQLLLVGLVLKVLFTHINFAWVAIMACLMLLMAGREVMIRQEQHFSGFWGYGLGTSSMFVSSFVVTLLVLWTIIRPQPWYEPRYAIPLLGMILGNTMTGIALALNSLTNSALQQREQIEARLMLGQSGQQALSNIRRQSIHNGLIPIINSMAAAGVVSLPGMMTGQILAGSEPMEAVKYQILVMFMIVAGTGFGTLGAVWLGSHRLFDERERLRLDRLSGQKR